MCSCGWMSAFGGEEALYRAEVEGSYCDCPVAGGGGCKGHPISLLHRLLASMVVVRVVRVRCGWHRASYFVRDWARWPILPCAAPGRPPCHRAVCVCVQCPMGVFWVLMVSEKIGKGVDGHVPLFDVPSFLNDPLVSWKPYICIHMYAAACAAANKGFAAGDAPRVCARSHRQPAVSNRWVVALRASPGLAGAALWRPGP